MKPALLFFVLLAATVQAQPPFLFTPLARSVRTTATGYVIDLAPQRLDVTRSGTGWSMTADGLAVATYRLHGNAWFEYPGGRTWRMDSIGRWHTSGGWILRPTPGGFDLVTGKGVTTWTRDGNGWVRIHTAARD